MEVGAVSESVQVTAAAPLLETETSTTGTVMTANSSSECRYTSVTPEPSSTSRPA